jgi:hypothetical protein
MIAEREASRRAPGQGVNQPLTELVNGGNVESAGLANLL